MFLVVTSAAAMIFIICSTCNALCQYGQAVFRYAAGWVAVGRLRQVALDARELHASVQALPPLPSLYLICSGNGRSQDDNLRLNRRYGGETECIPAKSFAAFAGTCISEGEVEMPERVRFESIDIPP